MLPLLLLLLMLLLPPTYIWLKVSWLKQQRERSRGSRSLAQCLFGHSLSAHSLLPQAEPFESEVEEADDPQQQQLDRQTSPAAAAAAAAAKPAGPVVIRPKGLIPGAKPLQGKPAAAKAAATAGGSKPPPAAAGAAAAAEDKAAAAERAAALMKEFAQPAPAAGSKRVVKVGWVLGVVWVWAGVIAVRWVCIGLRRYSGGYAGVQENATRPAAARQQVDVSAVML